MYKFEVTTNLNSIKDLISGNYVSNFEAEKTYDINLDFIIICYKKTNDKNLEYKCYYLIGFNIKYNIKYNYDEYPYIKTHINSIKFSSLQAHLNNFPSYSLIYNTLLEYREDILHKISYVINNTVLKDFKNIIYDDFLKVLNDEINDVNNKINNIENQKNEISVI